MGQPGMRITVDAAMRARDVSRPYAEGEEPPATPAQAPDAKPQKPAKPPKGERRRLGKRGARPRT